MIERALTASLLAALVDTPVVMLIGGRQTGKSTLVTNLDRGGRPVAYVTFDDPTELAAAKSDPGGYVERISGDVILDEV